MDIKELQKKLGFETKGELDVFFSKVFKFKNVASYQNSSAKKRYETAICKVYSFLIERKKIID